jgi:dUTP pyrophosphatase
MPSEISGSDFDIDIAVERLPHAAGLPLPAYHTHGAAGMDVLAAITGFMILPREVVVIVPTGLRIAIPHGYEVQVRPRSGMVFNHGVTVANAPGTIDSDYRGEIKVLLINHGKADYTIERGSRIAQLVVAPVTRGRWRETSSLDTTVRGEGGFGSTGR